MNPIRWSRRFATAVVSTLVGISCGEPDSVVSWVIPLDPVATPEAPLSDEGEIALAAETTACVIESYEYRVHCINRDDGSVNVFGRAGEGPGEFRDLTHVVRGSGGTIGVIDYALDRLTVFEPSGKRVSEARIPSGINPGVSLGHRLMGQRLELESISFRHLELDIASGKTTWQRIFPYRLAAEAGCKPGEGRPLPEGSVPRLPPSLGRGYMFPNHAMLFPGLCRGQMLYLASRDDDTSIVIQALTYTAERPSPKDVERYLENCGPAPFAFPATPNMFRLPCYEEEYRRTPKPYSDNARAGIDDHGRLWILTNRDRNEFSYLDIYVGPEYAGTVRVRHWAERFDVLGRTLAVLVDRPVGPDDPDGFPDRGIDWYDIGGLAFGSPPKR